ncbi:MAG: hypothetical protein K0Q49_2308 [Haloplasmataceae bacterium]|jgi:hypothetical protein|nr:hypothetical protein [Haloplasmataceae bacterium]
MLFFKKKFPNDEVGNALSNLYNSGVNFKVKQTVHFFINVNDKDCGFKILESLKQKGLEGKLVENNKIYKIIYSKHMLLEYEELVNIQSILNKISNPLGGLSDFWELKK